MCLNKLWPKRTSGSVCGSQVAEGTLFLQQGGVSVFGKGLKVGGSCFSSAMIYGKCSTSVLRLVLTGM